MNYYIILKRNWIKIVLHYTIIRLIDLFMHVAYIHFNTTSSFFYNAFNWTPSFSLIAGVKITFVGGGRTGAQLTGKATRCERRCLLPPAYFAPLPPQSRCVGM